jgi:hypothetical protein
MRAKKLKMQERRVDACWLGLCVYCNQKKDSKILEKQSNSGAGGVKARQQRRAKQAGWLLVDPQKP